MDAASEGATARAVALISEAADLAEPVDAAVAARMLTDAVTPAMHIYGVARAIELARRAVALADGASGVAELFARGRLGDALSWAGRYEAASVEWRRAAGTRAPDDSETLRERAAVLLRAGELTRAREMAYRAATSVRQESDVAPRLDALSLVVVAEIEVGRLREALAAAEEALAAAAGSDAEYLDAIGLVAWAEALLGYEPACRAHIAEAGSVVERLRLTSFGGLAE